VHGLQVGQPSALGPGGAKCPCTGVDVSDVLTELRTFAAHSTSI
jgi:hypothetical protein